jgi:hypothetical protein
MGEGKKVAGYLLLVAGCWSLVDPKQAFVHSWLWN